MKKILIIALLFLSLGNCKKQPSQGAPVVLWNSALSGSMENLKDDNGNKLVEFTDIAEQTVATKGVIDLSLVTEAQNCYRDEIEISCLEENFNYSDTEYQLIDAVNRKIETGTLNADGKINIKDVIDNGNYRLLLVDNPDLNWDHVDFKYEFDPVSNNKHNFVLKPKRKYYFAGMGEISGVVYSDAYASINGDILWPSLPLDNVPVKLKCKDSSILTTETDANGFFIFKNVFKNGSCRVTADGKGLSLFNSPYDEKYKDFVFNFIGKNENIATVIDIGKINLSWHPSVNGMLSLNWKIKTVYEADLSGFSVSLISNRNDIIATTVTDRNGNFSFNNFLIKNDYVIKISKNNFVDNFMVLPFEPNWDNSTKVMIQNKIPEMIPKSISVSVPNNFNVTLTPKSTYSELLKTNSILDSNWKESQLNSVTLIPVNGKIEIPPGKWEYFYSAVGYRNSGTFSIISNGENISLRNDIILTPSIYRMDVNGKLSLGNITTSNGVYVTLTGLKNNNGEEIILISKTVNGIFSFSENFIAVKRSSYCVTYPLCPNIETINLTGDNIALPIYFSNGKLLIPEGTYSWNVIDPIGTYSGNGTFSIIDNSIWGSINNINITLNQPVRHTVSGVLSDTFTMSSINGATISFGKGQDWNPLLIETSSIIDRNNLDLLNQINVTTSSTGGWTASNVPSGTWIVKITKEGYDTVYQTVTVPQTSQAVSSLISSGGKGNLSGRIILPGGFVFKNAFTLELTSMSSGIRPSNPQPIELKSGTTSFSNTSSYKLYNIDSGVWKMTFKSTTYETIICWVNIGPGENNYDVLTAVEGGQPPFPISGNLYNAINNRGITTPLTLTLRPGVGNTTGSIATRIDGSPYPVLISATDSTFLLPDVPAGVYTLSVTGTNWAPMSSTVVASAGISRYSLFISPVIPNDEIRIVLSWNNSPKDLDSHLEFGSVSCYNAGRCQVLWNDQSKLNGDLTLDVDVTTGLGPETITGRGSLWSQSRRGYSVYNWSNETGINNSGAVVRLFKNNASRTWSVPTNITNRWWNVFCLDRSGVPIEVGSVGCLSTSFWNVSQ